MLNNDNRLAACFSAMETTDSGLKRLPVGSPKVARGYLICITPRSGSTYLTHLLRDNRYFGYPQEWFNYDSIATENKDRGSKRTIEEYLEYLWDSHKTSTGVFGLQLSYPQFGFLNELIPLEGVLGFNFRWFFLVRQNLVLQAISLHIANKTGIWHSYSHLPNEQPDVSYDEKGIRANIEMILSQEESFYRLFDARNINPVPLTYEMVVQDPIGTINLFRNVLGVGGEIIAKDTMAIRRIGGERNQRLEERFRERNEEYLVEIIERRRQVLSMIRVA